MTLREKALEIAQGEIGNQEIPVNSNNGPHVKKYLAAVGLEPPQYWCMAFVMWCFQQASEAMGVKFPFIKTGGVMLFYNYVHEHHPEWIFHSPMPGDIFIIDFGEGHGHAGLVLKGGDLTSETIEGNSNQDGSRNGYEVAHRFGDHARKNITVKAFIRIPQ
jgi:hypothetical protein